MNLYLFDINGACFARLNGVGAELAQEIADRNGAASHVISDEEHPIDAVRVVDGEIQIVAPSARRLDYRERRYLAHRPIGDQLDDLWHAMHDGILPMVPAFYDPIAAVKAAIPKE